MRDTIAGYAEAVVEDAARTRGEAILADELAGIRDLVRRAPDLRVAVSDPGVPAPSRRGVFDDLLAGRVGESARRLVGYAIEADRAMELPEDLSWLASRAAAARDGLVSIEAGPFGRVSAGERLGGYATAILQSVDRHVLGEIEDELFRFVQVVSGSDQLRGVLTSRDVPVGAREGLVTSLLRGKATEQTLRLATYTVRVGRPRDYVGLLHEVIARVGEEANRRIADVRAPVELDDDARRRLADSLGHITGRQVEVRVSRDPSVLGGFVATIGDTVVDASARTRLAQVRERLVAPEDMPRNPAAGSGSNPQDPNANGNEERENR